MTNTECFNWFNSLICNSNCCKDDSGRLGCCSSYSFQDQLTGFTADPGSMALITVLTILIMLIILCACLDSMTSSSLCSCGGSLNELNKAPGYTLVQRPILIHSSFPEMILVEKVYNRDEETYSVLKEYSPNDRKLNFYGNHYLNNDNKAHGKYSPNKTVPSAPPSYYN